MIRSTLLAALLGSGAPAMAANTVTVDGSGAAEGLGLGIALGDPTGLSLEWRPNSSRALHAAVGWNAPHDTVHAHVDGQWTLVHLRAAGAPNLDFPFFIGVGGRFDSNGNHAGWGWGDRHGDASLGVGIPVGLGLVSSSAPFDVFIEVAPVLGLVPSSEVWVDATLAGHFYF